MILNVLAVGDVVGDSGVEYLSRHLRGLKKLKGVHFTVVNGENASGVGILPRQAREIFDAGADVVTLGNHTWNRIQIADFLEDDRYTLRPANYTSRVPGRGWGVYDGPGGVRIGVMNLIGRCEMDSNFDNPFTTADRVLRRMEGTDVVLVDAPCSGFGIIRKKPDVRYKKPDDLFALPVIQRAILDNAARYVRPGGTLVYSTCTILPEENEGVSDSFLAEHPDFCRTPFSLSGPVGETEGQVTLWPHRHGTDGFYICRMTRN